MTASIARIVLALAVAYPASQGGNAVAQVPVRTLAQSLAIKSDSFTLANGLRVVVHSDHSEPRVAVVVHYGVGARDEPAGRTGFAHLFEHLLFNGSENAPRFFPEYMAEMGASFNGRTTADFTAYHEVVPRTGLERALFLESDRMGHFLGTITQAVLDKERNVVLREKADKAGSASARLEQRLTAALYPQAHPYGHELLGSDADLRAASLDYVRDWYNERYGPANATLTLAGDIDTATARQLVTRYFGDLKGGVTAKRRTSSVPTLAGRIDDSFHDAIPAAEVHRFWAVPGTSDPRSIPLLAASRAMNVDAAPLKRTLVDREKLFSDIGIGMREQDEGSIFYVSGTVRDGVDPGVASRRLDALLAEALRVGPNAADIDRASVRALAAELGMNDSLLGRATSLGRGMLSGNPNTTADRAVAVSEQSAQTVAVSARTWLSRPAYALTILPNGPDDAPAVQSTSAPADPTPGPVSQGPVDPKPVVQAPSTRAQAMPPIGAAAMPSTPSIDRAMLPNGMRIVRVARPSVSTTHLLLDFDAGKVADPANAIGISDLLASVLDRGTRSRDATALAGAISGLGGLVFVNNNLDDTAISMSVPSANAGFGIDLLADIGREPRLDPVEVARARAAMLLAVKQEIADRPSSRVIEQLAGPGSIYASVGTTDPATLEAMDRTVLQAFHDAWFRPDHATLYVSTDLAMPKVMAFARHAFSDWQARGKSASRPVATRVAAKPGVYVIDRPNGPGVAISGLALTGFDPSADNAPLLLASYALNSSTGRLDRNLRQQRQWSYAAGGDVDERVGGVYQIVGGMVAAENAGKALNEFQKEIRAFSTTKPMTAEELARARETLSRGLVGKAAPGAILLTQIAETGARRRPDDFLGRLAGRFRSASLEEVRDAARRGFDPDRLVWVVTGNAASIGAQLKDQGIAFTQLDIPAR